MKKPPCGRAVPKGSRSALESDWKEKLSSYLQEKELKQSESRNHIIEVVLREEGHFSVADLVKKVQTANPGIGTATVYRSIPVLLDLGLIHETLTDQEGQMIYEVGGEEHHDHIVCLDCDRIFEFHDETIESAQDKVSRKMHFKPLKHRHVVYARCELLEKR